MSQPAVRRRVIRRRRLLAPILVVALATCLDAHAWETTFPLSVLSNERSEARAIAVGSGTIFAGGVVYTPGSLLYPPGGAFFVASLSPDTGDVVWQYDAGGTGGVDALVVDDAGNVIAAGATRGDAPPYSLTVVKLDGTTGDEFWRHDETAALASTVDVDEAGDVLVGGQNGDGAVVVKLAGATGSPLWTHPVDPLRPGNVIAVRRLGTDVVSLAVLDAGPFPNPNDIAVQRLAAEDGGERWRRDLDPIFSGPSDARAGSLAVGLEDRIVVVVAGLTSEQNDSAVTLAGADGSVLWSYDQLGTSAARALAFHPSGDVLVPELGGAVARLAAASGEVRWRHPLGCVYDDTVDGIAVDAAGDVLAAITAPGCSPEVVNYVSGRLDGFTLVAKLSAADGTETWKRLYDGRTPGPFDVNAIAASPAGDAIVGGGRYASWGAKFPAPGAFSVLSFEAADGSLRVCTDGFVDPGEACDDGNGDADPCCSGSCAIAAPDGTPCYDGDACTAGDACVAGACVPTGPLPCEPCGRCEPTIGCVPSPPSDCRAPTAAGKAVVSLADRRRVRDDEIVWQWKSGAATAKADFGNPLGATGYALCIYRDTTPVFIGTIPSNDQCPRKTCWRATRKGYVYQGRSGSPDGIASVTLQAGDTGRARVTVRGSGRKLTLPALPLETPVRVELRKVDGSEPCWTAQHDRVTTNRSDRFVATNGE
jgi:hypothetical protein